MFEYIEVKLSCTLNLSVKINSRTKSSNVFKKNQLYFSLKISIRSETKLLISWSDSFDWNLFSWSCIALFNKI